MFETPGPSAEPVTDCPVRGAAQHHGGATIVPHRARDIGSNFARCEVFATGSGTALVAAGG